MCGQQGGGGRSLVLLPTGLLAQKIRLDLRGNKGERDLVNSWHVKVDGFCLPWSRQQQSVLLPLGRAASLEGWRISVRGWRAVLSRQSFLHLSREALGSCCLDQHSILPAPAVPMHTAPQRQQVPASAPAATGAELIPTSSSSFSPAHIGLGPCLLLTPYSFPKKPERCRGGIRGSCRRKVVVFCRGRGGCAEKEVSES